MELLNRLNHSLMNSSSSASSILQGNQYQISIYTSDKAYPNAPIIQKSEVDGKLQIHILEDMTDEYRRILHDNSLEDRQSLSELFPELSMAFYGDDEDDIEALPPTSPSSPLRLDRFISAVSFLLPHQYVEAFQGDLIEKKSDMVSNGHTLWYVWIVLTINVAYTFWAAAWFKLKDIVSPIDKKELDNNQ